MDYDTDEDQANDNTNCLQTLLKDSIDMFCKERNAIEYVENLVVDPYVRLGYRTPTPQANNQLLSVAVQTEDLAQAGSSYHLHKTVANQSNQK